MPYCQRRLHAKNQPDRRVHATPDAWVQVLFWPAETLHQQLGFANGEAFGENGCAGRKLAGAIRDAENRTRVAHAERSRNEIPLDLLGQIEQAQEIGDRRPFFPDFGRDLLVGEIEGLGEVQICLGGFYRIEILALDVLDERQLQRFRRLGMAHHRGDSGESGQAGSPPAALTGDEFIATLTERPDDDRLYQPSGRDRS